MKGMRIIDEQSAIDRELDRSGWRTRFLALVGLGLVLGVALLWSSLT